MPGKRKRSAKSETEQPQGKKCRVLDKPPAVAPLSHPILSLYYPRIRSLREHLLQCLPPEARSRRRQIQAIPVWTRCYHIENQVVGEARDLHEVRIAHGKQQRNVAKEIQSHEVQNLSRLLDSTLIGVPRPDSVNYAPKEQDVVALFSQPSAATDIGSMGLGTVPLSEVGHLPNRLTLHVSSRKNDVPNGVINSLIVHANGSTQDC